MSEELLKICNEYNITGEGFEFIRDIEHTFNVVVKAETINGAIPTLCKWIEDNLRNAKLKGLNEQQKFMYSLGFLSNELMQHME